MSKVKDYEGLWATRWIDGISIYEKALELEKKLEEAEKEIHYLKSRSWDAGVEGMESEVKGDSRR